MQNRILIICVNVLLIIAGLIDASAYPSAPSYIRGFAGGVLVGAALNYYFDWRAKREQKAMEAIEHNLTTIQTNE